MNLACDSCQYEGDIDTFIPSMSIDSDCRCPLCGSTDNKHNSEYRMGLAKAWNCKHFGTLSDAGTGHNNCKLLKCSECGSVGLDWAMRGEPNPETQPRIAEK